MAEKVTLKLSAAAASCVRRDASKETRLKAATGALPFADADLGGVLFFLGHDPDPEIRAAAVKRLRELSEAQVLAIIGPESAHPKILDILARLHYLKQSVMRRLLTHPAIAEETLAFLSEKGGVREEEEFSEPSVQQDTGHTEDTEDMEEVDEESEAFKSKYKLSLEMKISEKIKMALTGDKEWRSLLIKDANKLVSGAVVKNPRMTEPEVLAIAKSAIQNDEIMRVICQNKEWVKNYAIRKALVLNNKTPLPTALRFLASLGEKDVAAIAKSKNVSSVISNQARRVLLNKKKG